VNAVVFGDPEGRRAGAMPGQNFEQAKTRNPLCRLRCHLAAIIQEKTKMIADQLTSAEHHELVVRAGHRLRETSRDGGEVLPARSLQKDVVAALVRSGYAALSSVGCEVSDERVVLFGAVPTYHLKQLAQVFAQRVDGVGKVVNRIAVFA
jgi:hypothetical protein